MALTKVQTIGIETGISLTGVTTVTTLNASTDTLSVGGTVNFGGNVSIAGTLTYEDVTNIDSVGIITARNGIKVNDLGVQVGTGATVDSAADNTLTFLTNGSERVRITSAGLVGIGTVSPSGPIHAHVASGTQRSYLEASASHTFLRLKSGSTSYNSGLEFFSGASNIANINGLGAGGLQFEVNGSEAARFDSSGRVLIGATSSADVGFAHGLQVESLSSNRGISIIQNSNDQFASHIDFAKTRGTSTGSNTAVQSGDDLGSIIFRGADGTDKASNAAFINCEVDGTPGSNDMPGRLIFATTADGAASATERMRIDSSGIVKIDSGTNTNGILRLVSSGSGNANMRFQNTTTGTGDSYGFYVGINNDEETYIWNYHNNFIAFGTNDTERMRIDTSGNMGLGETSADTRLHIKESTTGATGIFIQNSNGATNSSADLYFGNWNGSSTTTPQARIQAINKNVNTAATDLAFWTYSGSSTIERMRIDSDGDIHHTGVTSAGGSNKRARYLVPSHNTNEEDVVVFQVENESGNNQITIGGGTASYNAATTLVFRTAAGVDTTTGEYRARIDSNGDFLVQTTSNTRYTQTSGAGSWGYSADTGTDRGSVIHANNADNGWSMMYMNKFDWASGHDGRYINFYKNGNSLSSIELNSSGTVDYNTGSDYRLKENIVPMTNGITRIKQLLPKQFNMIDDPDNNLCDGFLAHEAQTVVPQAVCGTHDGMKTNEEGNVVPDYQGMDYGKLTPLLTAALQEAIAKIETLEAKVAALEG